MLFSTIEFVVFFVVVLAAITIIKNRQFQHLFLLFASFFFFYYSSNYLLILLISSILLDFYLGKQIWKTESQHQKKILLALSLAGNLALLGFFKYADFAILQFNILGQELNFNPDIPFLDLALPIGISFYTFQSITYTVDIYRGKLTPSKTLREFALFVSFFPQLVAGPIVRASEFLPQLRAKIQQYETGTRLRQIVIENPNLRLGITVMAFGFFKKIFIADNLILLTEHPVPEPELESFMVIIRTIAFGIRIYCDFSGYTDIAIGAAMILGFKLPVNFNKPYFATSPSDFWRRWHISLSSWLRDYLYIPLGGNRKSPSITYLNLIIVMFLGGLWHGASWNFVIWGLLHGLYLAIHKMLLNKFPVLKDLRFFKTKTGKIMSIFITQYFIFLAWIPFTIADTNLMFVNMQKYVFLDFLTENSIPFIISQKYPIAIMGFFVLLHLISYRAKNLPMRISKLKLPYWILFLFVALFFILFFYNGNPEPFIYFKF